MWYRLGSLGGIQQADRWVGLESFTHISDTLVKMTGMLGSAGAVSQNVNMTPLLHGNLRVVRLLTWQLRAIRVLQEAWAEAARLLFFSL